MQEKHIVGVWNAGSLLLLTNNIMPRLDSSLLKRDIQWLMSMIPKEYDSDKLYSLVCQLEGIIYQIESDTHSVPDGSHQFKYIMPK